MDHARRPRLAQPVTGGHWRQRGWLYALRSESRDAVKLGFSTQPEKRLYELSRLEGEPLEPVWLMPGTPRDEQRLHALLDADRLDGEWFRDHDPLRHVLEVLARGECA